ncbi:hypothetical protein JCM10207_004009 [Rhodosporidiobolus poonsookiae]
MSTISTPTVACITGASGYVGSAIALLFLQEGHTVRLPFRSQAQIDAWTAALPQYKDKMHFVLIKGSLGDDSLFDEAIQGCEVVVHAASPLSFDIKTTAENDILKPAVQGTVSVLTGAKKAGCVRSLVLTTSLTAHGDTLELLGMSKDRLTVTDETWNLTTYAEACAYGPEQGVFVYFASKSLAERAARDWVEREKPAFTLAAVAPSTVFGIDTVPGTKSLEDLHSTLRLLLQQLWDKKEFPKRDGRTFIPETMISIGDVAKAHVAAALNPSISNGHRYPLIGCRCDWPHIVKIMVERQPELAKHLPPVPETLEEPLSSYDFVADQVEKAFGFKYEPLESFISALADQLVELAKADGVL